MDTIVGKQRSRPEIDHTAGGVEGPEILVHSSLVAAWRRSARASRSTAATVPALEILAAIFGLRQLAAALRQTRRARSKALSVVSCSQ
jgi:hypothetical protein